MRPTHFELMCRSMATHIDAETLYPYVCKYLESVHGTLEFGEKNKRGQMVTLVDDGLLIKRLQDAVQSPEEAELYGMIHEAMFGHMNNIMISMYKYHHHGQKVFHFNRGITELIHNTDLAGTYEFLRFPYPSFYMQFEGCPIWIDVGRDHEQVYGVYVDSTRDDLSVFLAISKPQNDHLGGSVWVRASVDKDMDPAKKISMDDLYFGDEPPNPAVEIAVKALLYLNSDNPDIKKGGNERKVVEDKLTRAKEPQKKKRLTKQLLQMSVNEYMDVGSTIKVQKGKNAETTKQDFDGGYHFSYRFWVRGHFRNQACGAGRTQRKLIWIQPHMKGPDQAEVLHKQYQVEEG